MTTPTAARISPRFPRSCSVIAQPPAAPPNEVADQLRDTAATELRCTPASAAKWYHARRSTRWLVSCIRLLGSDSGHSEPIVRDTSPIAWEVASGLEPVVTDDENLRHVLGIGQAQVDPHGTSPLFACVQASPIRHAATRGAEVKHDPPSSCVGLGRTRDIDAAALEFVGPQRAVATTCGAIARRGRLGHPFEAPLNCAAVARASDHFSGCLTDRRISCEAPPPPCDVAPERPPPEIYHALRSTRWIVSCLRLLGGGLSAPARPEPV
jgi:hypothetical protein